MSAKKKRISAKSKNYPKATRTPREGIFLITPAIAQFWLDQMNTNNWRKMNDRTVAEYQRQIEAGLWLLSTDSIAFDWNGVLIDGQHRLMAIALSGKSVPCRVIVDVDPQVRDVVDTGRGRKASETLRAHGYKYGAIVPTVLRFWVARESQTKGVKISNRECLAMADQFAAIDALCGAAHSAYCRQGAIKLFSPAPVAAAAFVLHEIKGPKTAYAFISFMERVASGEGIKAKSPEKALISRLQREKVEGEKHGRRSISAPMQIYLMLSAYRSCHYKRTLSSVQLAGQESPWDLPFVDRK